VFNDLQSEDSSEKVSKLSASVAAFLSVEVDFVLVNSDIKEVCLGTVTALMLVV
jgi:hypothetical protein